MSKLKIFVSSTCYDLNIVRSQLRAFIQKMGYEPVMSDYNDVLYDPRVHTHESCLKEVQYCDMVILIIGSRFGGKATPEVVNKINWDKLKDTSKDAEILKDTTKLSITQMEIFKAIEAEIPIYTFVESNVFHDHLFYEKNKNTADIINKVTFPSIEKRETATYIFEFINYLRLRGSNNSFSSFSKIDDIEDYLKAQWASLFQRLLEEQFSFRRETKMIDIISNQIEDMKAVVVSSISNQEMKDTARYVLRFRSLIVFSYVLSGKNGKTILQNISWEQFLNKSEIVDIVRGVDERGMQRRFTYYIRKDGTFFEARFFDNSRVKEEWDMFRNLDQKQKEAIIEAVVDQSNYQMTSAIRYRDYSFEKFSEENNIHTLKIEA